MQDEKEKEDSVLSCFLEDENGNVISESQRCAITSTAGSFWWWLLENDRAPKTFRCANFEVQNQWRTFMESSFECLRYCENHWKADQIWINYYSSWKNSSLTKLKNEQKQPRSQTKEQDDNVVINVEDNNREIQEVEMANRNQSNKRGPLDNGKTNGSKRRRVEGSEMTLSGPHPKPTGTTTNCTRVSKPFLLDVFITNNIQINPLYEDSDCMHVGSIADLI
jgi:hypothetical protein